MEWHHPQSTRGEKKFKSSPSASNVINAVFWDCEGVILVVAMLIGETGNSDAYIRTRFKQESNRNAIAAWKSKTAHK
jgi:hypothetical protein